MRKVFESTSQGGQGVWVNPVCVTRRLVARLKTSDCETCFILFCSFMCCCRVYCADCFCFIMRCLCYLLFGVLITSSLSNLTASMYSDTYFYPGVFLFVLLLCTIGWSIINQSVISVPSEINSSAFVQVFPCLLCCNIIYCLFIIICLPSVTPKMLPVICNFSEGVGACSTKCASVANIGGTQP